jgi:hypothetical protein
MSDRTGARKALVEFLADVEPFVAAIEGVSAALESNGGRMGPEQMRRMAEADPDRIYMEIQGDPGSLEAVRDKAHEGLEQARKHHGIMQRALRTRKRIGAEQARLNARLSRMIASLQKIVAWLERLHEKGIDTYP